MTPEIFSQLKTTKDKIVFFIKAIIISSILLLLVHLTTPSKIEQCRDILAKDDVIIKEYEK